MNQKELEYINDNPSELTDMEPTGDIKGGPTNTYRGTTTVNEGTLTLNHTTQAYKHIGNVEYETLT